MIGKTEKQKLEIIFGAILTQNTSWKNVERAIIEMHKHDLMSVDAVLKTPKEMLAKIIKSSGYYNQKANTLKTVGSFLKEYSIKSLEQMDLIKVRGLLLKISGIGPETADSILLYALGKPIFVADTYTKRLLLKKGWIKETATYGDIQGLFMENLPPDVALFNEYHALIVAENKVKSNKDLSL